MAGSTTFRFKPQLFPDSILIFVLGFTETLVIYHMFSDLYLWCYSMATVTFVGWLALVNGLYNARQHPVNDIIFQRLGNWPRLIQIQFFVTVILYVLFGTVSYQYAKNQTLHYVIASIFLIFVLMYLVGGFKYWALIVSKSHTENKCYDGKWSLRFTQAKLLY